MFEFKCEDGGALWSSSPLLGARVSERERGGETPTDGQARAVFLLRVF